MEASFIALAIIILLFSVIIHEVMHGLAALKFGDRTAENAGRLTLNPIPHIDPLGTILLPALLIISGAPILLGWAKPVPINPLNFTNIRKGELVVALAGVFANFSLAIFAAALFHLSKPLVDPLVSNLLRFTIDINLILAVFNSLPIPPLDGSKVILAYLPHKYFPIYNQLERYGFFILLFLLVFPFGNSSILGSILGVILNFLHLLLQV